MIDLDRLGTQLKYFSQKQDSILIKNLLITTQNRWEKIVSRCAERSKDLERAYKESKQFYDLWQGLSDFIHQSMQYLSQDFSLNQSNPQKIKQMLSKHKDFQKQLNLKHNAYESTMKQGKKLLDKFDSTEQSVDKQHVQDILNDMKQKWQQCLFQSAASQKRLEDALLMSGQFRDALLGLLEWMSKIEPTLAEKSSLNGNLDSVLALIEDNQQFQ
jgi:deoxyadenosine/deoxycytidine kinase